MGACCCRASCGTRRRWELKVVVRTLDGYGRLPRWLRVLLALSWMAVLWWLTARPSGGLPLVPIHPMLTNGAHVVTFGILASLLFLAGDGDPRRRCLWAATSKLGEELRKWLPMSDILVVDSLPVPICAFKRAHFSNTPLKQQDVNGVIASWGHCETKDLGTYLGFKVHLIISEEGIPLRYAIGNADIDDREVLPLMSEHLGYSWIIGDKGYVSEQLSEQLWELDSVRLLAQKRSNQKQQYPKPVKKQLGRIRKRVESTINQLEDQFHLARVRARSHWGLYTRIGNKFAAFTLGAFLNQCLGRPLLALKDLVFA